jgi:hypothetical protein
LYQFYITEEHSVQIQAMPNNNKKDDVRTWAVDAMCWKLRFDLIKLQHKDYIVLSCYSLSKLSQAAALLICVL